MIITAANSCTDLDRGEGRKREGGKWTLNDPTSTVCYMDGEHDAR